MSSGTPLALSRAAVDLAVWFLPELDDRLRYRAEFLAELHDLSPARQLRYSAGVLSQTFALRAALGSTPSRAEEDVMTITRTRTFYWRCRVLRRHHWVQRSTEDGSRYHACSRCGRDRGDSDLGGGPTVGIAGMAG